MAQQQTAQHTQGPWQITFEGNLCGRGVRAGFYASRPRLDGSAPNAREWLHNGRGALARFASREDARAAIAKAGGAS
jgi:hypothetical protein